MYPLAAFFAWLLCVWIACADTQGLRYVGRAFLTTIAFLVGIAVVPCFLTVCWLGILLWSTTEDDRKKARALKESALKRKRFMKALEAGETVIIRVDHEDGEGPRPEDEYDIDLDEYDEDGHVIRNADGSPRRTKVDL